MVDQRPVVVGVDGSAGSDLAVRWGADAASRRRLPLRLVHVVARLRAIRPSTATAIMSSFDWTEWGRAITRDAARLARHAAPTLAVETEVFLTGAVAEVLAREAAAAELLALGANRQGRVTEGMLGSVAINVAESATGSIVIVRERAGPSLEAEADRVVVGVDGSDPALHALRFALTEAALRGAELEVVRAWTDPWRASLRPEEADGGPDRSLLERQAAGVLSDSVAEATKDLPDVAVTERLINKQPGAALLDAARQATLLVVGSRGHGGLAGLRLGSVSHGMLHQADCPVAVIRPPDAAAARPPREDRSRS
jgi:nucleotide-binding universal stress UspA family protein